MWSDHLGNKQAVEDVFGSNIPALERLELMQVVVNEIGGLDVALNLAQLPDTVPARWKERGCDRVQLRFRFVVDELVLQRRQPGDGDRTVAVDLDKNRLRIASPDGFWDIAANVHHASLEFYPYRSDDYDLSPRWLAR
jgi:hypothetical protein